ncbi:hypothetical protein WH279_19375 [Erwinia sp. MYb375]|uniref:hypothetical protein n=1 Tax=unclassified Erwinia TaxID=2622719 RepID=UPI00309BCE24
MDYNKKVSLLTSAITVNKNLEEVILDSQYLGEILWHNKIGVFSLPDFENKITEKFDFLVDEFKKEHKGSVYKDPVFVVTEAFNVGGHTRLMERLASFMPNKPNLIITRPIAKEVISRLSGFFESLILCSSAGVDSEVGHVKNILKEMLSYDEAILNIHPDDIHSVIACSLAKKINHKFKVYFVNHADHVFSFGQTISDVWFEISSSGRKLDTLKGISCEKSFLGIPLFENFSELKCRKVDVNDQVIYLTAAAGYKFRPIQGEGLGKLAREILKKYPKSIFNVVGCDPLRDYWWWLLKVKYRHRINLIKKLDYNQYMTLANKADVYIDSHPMPGGSAFAEQFISGRLCSGLLSPFQGFTPLELLKKSSSDEVLQFLSEGLTENYESELRNKIKQVHGYNNVKQRFLDAIYHNKYHSNLIEEIVPWTGDVHFGTLPKIVRIPDHFLVNNNITRFALKNSTLVVKLKFLLKKITIGKK